MLKRFAVLASILIISSTSVLSFADSNVIQNNESNIPLENQQEKAITMRITQDNVRFRKTPGLSGTIITHLHKNHPVYYTFSGPQDVKKDGYTWKYVRDLRSMNYGWVAADYLSY